jgi:Aspartyl/Asparaginyl beta-hydroxylase
MHIDVTHRLIDRIDTREVERVVLDRLAPLYEDPESVAWRAVRERCRFIGQQNRPADVGYRTMKPTGYLQFCLVNDEDPYSPWALPLPEGAAADLAPFKAQIDALCEKHWGPGEVHLCVFAVLAPRGHVPTHRDLAHAPEKKAYSHHLHVPLLHTEGAAFTIGDETFRMEHGGVYEIDNTVRHSTLNHGEHPRVNVMIDYRARVDQPAASAPADLGSSTSSAAR